MAFDSKVFDLAVLFAFCCRSKDKDRQMTGFIDNDDNLELNNERPS